MDCRAGWPLSAVLLLALIWVRPVGVGADAPHATNVPSGLAAPFRLAQDDAFTFDLTADMRLFSGPGTYDSSDYFRGACESIAAIGPGAFMISPGDIDPPEDVYWTIQQVLGEAYPWFPVVGNHESETVADMTWLRAFDVGADADPDWTLINAGPASCPETTYSFDYRNVHIIILNEYCDDTHDDLLDGDVRDTLYDWLVADLAANRCRHTIVVGHEPAYPQPDAATGRVRHLGSSLDGHAAHRDRFWQLLVDWGVAAYFCGHTHNYSAVRIEGVWQVDVGHARGVGDTGAPSTHVQVRVDGDEITLNTYRRDADSGAYLLAETLALAAAAPCGEFLAGESMGIVESSALTEISGLAASRRNAGVCWVHNDSGDSARVFAMSESGAHLGTYSLNGASARDWEDMAIGPGPDPGVDYLYVADTGDNRRQRVSVTVYRVPEPMVTQDQAPVTETLDDVEALPMCYPEAAFDCETLLVDPETADVYLVTRDREGTGQAHVYRCAAPHTPGVMATLELVTSIALAVQQTGGDVSPDGSAVLLRAHAGPATLWSRPAGGALWEVFLGTSCLVPLASEPQGEAIAWSADGAHYFSVSEGAHQPVYRYAGVVRRTLVPRGGIWHYADDGQDRGTTWRDPSLGEDAWPSGPAPLGYGNEDEVTILGYGPDAANKPITTYLRRQFEVAHPAAVRSLTIEAQRDDGLVVYLNGAEVWRNNMPDGAIDAQTLAPFAIGGDDEATWITAEVGADALLMGTNTIAVELHQHAGTSSDIRLDLALLAAMDAPTAVERVLTPGWHLLSLPLVPESSRPALALASITGRYDAIWTLPRGGDEWLLYDATSSSAATLTALDEATPFWLHVTEGCNLRLSGWRPATTEHALASGWNLIAYCGAQPAPVADVLASIHGRYVAVWAHDPGDEGGWLCYAPSAPEWANTLSFLQPGDGYWVLATQDGTLTLDCGE